MGNSDKRVVWVEHVNVCRIIQYIALLHGFDINLSEAEEVWQEYSSSLDAGWILESYHDLEHMWSLIKNQFVEDGETAYEFDQRVLEGIDNISWMIKEDGECDVDLIIKSNY